MTERSFDTEFWDRPFTEELSIAAKLLYIYSWTNSHCNQAGLYKIGLGRIAIETGIPRASLPSLFKELEVKIQWFPEHNILWVRNFLRRQTKSPYFLKAAVKNVLGLNVPEEIKDAFQEYNSELLQGATVSQSLTRRECVGIRDLFICQYCGSAIESNSELEVDHIIPVSRGGKDNYQNLVCACQGCNQKKLDNLPGDVGLNTPKPQTFHAAQAIYILKNNSEIRAKWLSVFPHRYNHCDSILNQYCSILSNVGGSCPSDLVCTDSLSDSLSDKGFGERERKGDWRERKKAERAKQSDPEEYYKRYGHLLKKPEVSSPVKG
ncbi:HNH endonuclease [Candidatus Magnetobacterium casense]|uniref:HNH endonuclease n=1 Tax=Candidatus Magnetobacterium casense TaxID=1455061 RepID=A0ABS6RXV4_9BACT|nr:HNH endonuclease signature motif containing protein [Candidatus Magnetobacterium casensis]MBV6341472.1 HNH endonuclease [Candidatus Magnetobacterium casensis]